MTIFNADKAIEKKEEDFLGRQDFSETITNAILKNGHSESLTIGLYGKWGSGKTSIINMILEDIKKEDDIIFFKFEPWLYSDTQQLISQFFKQFSKVINHKDYGKEAEKIGNELETYATFFDTISLIPEPTTIILSKIASKVFGNVGKASTKWSKQKSKSLSGTKISIEEHLKKFNKKILIVIDDIDRLNNTEIRQIFQMIKVLGNFPNTIYLTSMDKEVVKEALKEVQKGDGSEYLEKIIHVPLNVPSMSKSDIDKFLLSKLTEIISNIKDEDFDENYFWNIYHSGFKYFFKNIRDVIRYINILQFNYSALKNKVNIIDLIAITAFQVFEPRIYELIRDNATIFIGGLGNLNNDEKENIKNFFENSYNELERLSKENYLNLIQELFVKIKGIYNNTTYLGILRECRKEGKVCSPEFFDVYFKMTLNDNTISNYSMKEYINSASDESTFEQTIIDLIERSLILKFLDRIEDYIDDIEKEKYQIIINVLMNIGDSFPEERGMFSFGTNLSITRVFHQLLNKIETDEERFDILKEAIKSAENSINIIVYEVSLLMQIHGEYGKEAKHESEQIVTNEQLQILKEILKDKIQKWIEKCPFYDLNDPLILLYMWKRLDEDKAKEYLIEQTQTDNGLIKFLEVFNSVSYSQSLSDYVQHENKEFKYKDIAHFIDQETIVERVQEIQKNIVNYDITEESIFAISMFIKNHDEIVEE